MSTIAARLLMTGVALGALCLATDGYARGGGVTQTVRPPLARFHATRRDEKARFERPVVSALASGRERHPG